jgi:streptogramin lyase
MIGSMSRLFPGLAVAAAVLAVAAPAANADVTPQFFPLPAALGTAGSGIAAAPDGTVYFGSSTYNDMPQIGRLDPALATPGTANGITSVTTPKNPALSGTAFIRDVSFSPELNTLWFVRSDGTVGRLDGSTVTTKYLPLTLDLWGIAAGPGGVAWLTENGFSNVSPTFYGNRIAKVSASLAVTDLPNFATQNGETSLDPLRYPVQPQGIAVGPDGTPWFAEANPGNPGYRIGRVDGSAYKEFRPCPTSALCSGTFTGTGISDVTVGSDGMVWYTNETKKTIGRFDPSSQLYVEFSLTSMDPSLGAGTPKALATAPDGSIWAAISGFSQAGANAIIKLVPGASVTSTVYKLGASLAPTSITTDTKGNVWFSGSAFGGPGGVGRLADVTGSGPSDPTPTPDPTTGQQPPLPAPSVSSQPVTTTLTPVTTAQASVTDPTVRGDSVNANQICVGPPQDRCSLVYLIQTHEYVKGFPNTHGYAAKATKLTTIGTLKVTLKGGQKKKVTIKLNSKGKKLRKKMSFKATLTVTQAINGSKPKTVLKKNLKFKK